VNSWKVILATLVIFGTGVITGGLLVTYSGSVLRDSRPEAPRRIATPVPRDNRPPIPQAFFMRTNFIDSLDRELKLTAAQREQIEKIIRDGQDHIKELSQEIQPRVRTELVETRGKIRAELTPEQQVLYEQLLRRRPNPSRAGTNAPSRGTTTDSPLPRR